MLSIALVGSIMKKTILIFNEHVLLDDFAHKSVSGD